MVSIDIVSALFGAFFGVIIGALLAMWSILREGGAWSIGVIDGIKSARERQRRESSAHK